MNTLDVAAKFRYKTTQEKLEILSAALCHDLGKITATYIENGRIRNIGHEEAGVSFTQKLMARITNDKSRIRTVCRLVKYHMKPASFVANRASDKAYYKLALKLSPVANMHQLALLAKADCLAKPLKTKESGFKCSDTIKQFINKSKKLKILTGPIAPALTGRDLLPFLPQGKTIGKLVKKAYEIQICQGIFDKNELLKHLKKEIARYKFR